MTSYVTRKRGKINFSHGNCNTACLLRMPVETSAILNRRKQWGREMPCCWFDKDRERYAQTVTWALFGTKHPLPSSLKTDVTDLLTNRLTGCWSAEPSTRYLINKLTGPIINHVNNKKKTLR